MTTSISNDYSEQFLSALKKEGINIEDSLVFNPFKQLPDFLKNSTLPKVIILPYSQWPPSLLNALITLKTKFIASQETVVKYINEHGGSASLTPIWPGNTETVYKTPSHSERPYDISFVGQPHKTWLTVVNAEHSFKITYNIEQSANNLETSKVAIVTEDAAAIQSWIFDAIVRNTVLIFPESHKNIFSGDFFLHYANETLIETIERLLNEPGALEKWSSRALEWLKNKVNNTTQAKFIASLSSSSAPELPANKQQLATLYYELGDWEKARAQFKELAAANNDPLYLNNLGVLKGLGNEPDAEEVFKKSGTRTAVFNLAIFYYQNKKNDLTIENLKKSLSMEGAFEGLIYPLSFTGDGTALPLLQAVPGSPEWKNIIQARHHELISYIYWQMGKKKEAIESLKEANRILPDNPQILFNLGGQYFANKMIAHPIKYWNQVLKLNPFDFNAQQQFANIYSQLEMNDQSIHILKQAVKFPKIINRLRPEMLMVLAVNLYHKQKYDEAVETCLEAIKDDPENRSYKNQLAVIYVKQAIEQSRQHQKEQALESIGNALKYEPDLPIAYNVLGSISYEDGDFETAKKFFQKAIDGDPELTVAKDNLAECESAEKIKVSLIIVSHFQEKTAKKYLSVISQFSEVTHEILYIYPYGETPWDFLKDVPNLRLIQANYSGIAEAYNTGISYARGRYFVFMEDDILVGPQWLSSLINILENDESVGAVGPITNFCSNPEQIPQASDLQEGVYETEMLDSFCIAIKRNILTKIGLWDPQFLIKGYEDTDFSLRMKLSGKKLLAARTVFVNHAGLMPYIKEEYNSEEIDRKNHGNFAKKWEQTKVKTLV